jgi:hypothetical protein
LQEKGDATRNSVEQIKNYLQNPVFN